MTDLADRTMRAVRHTRYGPPDVLHVVELPVRRPGPGEVLVRVRAAEATKSDCELRAFRFPVSWFWLPLRLALGISRPRRQVLGAYFAGEVVATGPGVEAFAAGDRVFGSTGLRLGAYGEYLVLPATSSMARMPSTMDFAQAAAVPLGGLNALHFMRLAAVRTGERVLIHGAGGSIGAHAVQIARSMGGRVTAVDHPSKEAFLRGLGAADFIDYTREDFAAAGRRYDVILSMVASVSYLACLRSLAPGGRFLTANPRLSLMLLAPLLRRWTGRKVVLAFAGETVEALQALGRMIDEGQIVPIVDRVLPMEQAAEAHRLVEAEQRLGAVVLQIGA